MRRTMSARPISVLQTTGTAREARVIVVHFDTGDTSLGAYGALATLWTPHAAASAHPEDRAPDRKRQQGALRNQEGALATYPQDVALAVRDYQDRRRRREVLGPLEEVDAWLQPSPAAPWRGADPPSGRRPGRHRDRLLVSVLVSFVGVRQRPTIRLPIVAAQVRTPLLAHEPRREQLESVLGATPHEFESRILRQCLTGHDVDGPRSLLRGPTTRVVAAGCAAGSRTGGRRSGTGSACAAGTVLM